jgi:ribosomal protein S18 acetylase RimI-like enzyme
MRPPIKTTDPSRAVTIRAATPADVEALVRLLEQLHPAFPANRALARSVLETMLSQNGRRVLVAETEGQVRGTADLIIVPNLTHDASPWAIVENLVVDEQSRGRGIGRSLMDDIVRRAEDAGCYMIQLVSLKHRTDAHAFYGHNDFQPVAEGLRRYLNGYAPTGSNGRPDTSAPT